MGYFVRKLRRSTAGRNGDRFVAGAVAQWPRATTVPAGPGYVRLGLADGRTGLFQAAYRLRASTQVTDADRVTLAAALRWFERRLRPHAPRKAAAVFWFKADAVEHVRHVWPVVDLLQRYGGDVRMLTSRQPPGRVVFEDGFQVAAVGVAGCRPRWKQLPEPT